MTRAEETRERILFGAEEVVLRDGVAHLTLEAAASEAGVSKGGVLYHFPTRAALVAAMVQRLCSLFDADLEREGLSGRPGAFAEAYLEATFGPPVEDAASRERRLGAAVIAGLAADPELLEPLRERFARWQHTLVTDGLPPATASLLRLAADGLWFTELFGLAPLEPRLPRLGARRAPPAPHVVAGTTPGGPQGSSSDGTSHRPFAAREDRDVSIAVPATTSAHRDSGPRRVVVALSVSTFAEWAGAGAVIPLLPLYLRHRGAPVALVGAAMAAFFFAAIFVQYPVGRLSDRIGRRPIQLGGLVAYAAASTAFALLGTPVAALFVRALQGAGAGVVDVANNATIGEIVPAPQQGRAYGALFGSRTVGLAIGPFIGGLVGIGAMRWLFVGAAIGSLLACVPVLVAVPRRWSRPPHVAAPRVVLWRDRSVLGVALGYAGTGVVIGVYEVCWSLLLHLRGASQWQIGLSWTLFALPFAAMSIPGGWLVDHFDRRYLAAGSTLVSAGFAAVYAFLHVVWLLICLGSAEAVAVAIAGPALASQLAHSVPSRQLGRAQGGASTAQTATTAVAAAGAGALFALHPWVPFVGASMAIVLVVVLLCLCWRGIPGRGSSSRESSSFPIGAPGASRSAEGCEPDGYEPMFEDPQEITG